MRRAEYQKLLGVVDAVISKLHREKRFKVKR